MPVLYHRRRPDCGYERDPTHSTRHPDGFELSVCAVTPAGEYRKRGPRLPSDEVETSSHVDGTAADRDRSDVTIRVGVPWGGLAGGSVQRRNAMTRLSAN